MHGILVYKAIKFTLLLEYVGVKVHMKSTLTMKISEQKNMKRLDRVNERWSIFIWVNQKTQ